jgi:hypothetical protein
VEDVALNWVSKAIAEHIREVHCGGNWTASSVKECLSDVSWGEATHEIIGCNSIVMLTYHINYFVRAAIDVLERRPLTANDEYSFNVPELGSRESWDAFVQQVIADGLTLADLVQKLPEVVLTEAFANEKYGSYYRNLQGIVEHAHYHLGQIALLKKIIRTR